MYQNRARAPSRAGTQPWLRSRTAKPAQARARAMASPARRERRPAGRGRFRVRVMRAS